MNRICDFVKIGDSGITVVVIPGLSTQKVTGANDALETTFGDFKGNFTIYVVDRPDEVPDDCTNEYLAETIVETMQAQGVFEACVIGVSQGGMIAQHLAVKHPEFVKALVLGATLCRANDQFTGVIEHWMQLVESDDYEEFKNDAFRRFYSDEFLQATGLLDNVPGVALRPNDKEWFRRLASACLTAGPADRLSEITCPTLVLGGGLDSVVTIAGSEEIAATLGCGLHIYPNLRHAIYDETPDFYKRSMEFLFIVSR